MKVIVLAAGYATRLYPLTENCPKPLLPVAGIPMLDHVLRTIKPITGIDEIIVVTNHKFAPHFNKWAENFNLPGKKILILDDLTTDDSNKKGAVGDIHYVLTQLNIDDDILVLAGDNLFENDLKEFGDFCKKIKAPVVGIYDVGSIDLVKKYSCVTMTPDEGKITSFEEKPQNPQNTNSAIALYYYPADVLSLIKKYIHDGNNPDQPGRLVQWMYTRIPFYTWKISGLWYDIGSKEALAEADDIFKNLRKDVCDRK
jgi:glucose-1-phosphate thymidylyltransferase